MVKYGDLHTHSFYSDGVFGPLVVAKHVRNRGLDFFSLTDHNTFAGLEELMGNDLNIEVIPGVEVETLTGEVLGYFFVDSFNELSSLPVNDLLLGIRDSKNKNVEYTVNNLISEGYDFSFDDLIYFSCQSPDNLNLNTYHITNYLVKNDLIKSDNFEDVFKLIKGVSGRISYNKKDVQCVVKAIHDSGGAPVLAHPWRNDYEVEFKLMPKLIELGLCGIEVTGDFSNITPEEKSTMISWIYEFCFNNGLVFTGGSDFHRPLRDFHSEDFKIPYSVINDLRSFINDFSPIL